MGATRAIYGTSDHARVWVSVRHLCEPSFRIWGLRR